MTLKQFVDKIGGYTDENMKVVIRTGMNGYDDGRLCNIRARLKNEYYVQEYEGWSVSFFNIVENTLMIQMTPKKNRKENS